MLFIKSGKKANQGKLFDNADEGVILSDDYIKKKYVWNYLPFEWFMWNVKIVSKYLNNVKVTSLRW